MKKDFIIPDPIIENTFINVYTPSDDSYLIIDYFKENLDNRRLDGIELEKIKNVLDMGTGTGIIALFFLILKRKFLNFIPKIYASDILEDAIKCSKINEANNYHEKEIKYFKSDLFKSFPENLKHKFDLIVFNPPYLPSIKPLENGSKISRDISWDGGAKGIEILENFLDQVAEFINLGNKSYIYFISSSRTDINTLNSIISNNGFNHRFLRKKHIFFEDIILNRLENKIPSG